MKTSKHKFLNRLFITIITFTMTISMTGISSLAASGDTIVYITKTGKCYHSASCSSLSKSKIETTLKSASGKYSPCSKCSPPILDSAPSETAEAKASTTTKSTTTKATSAKKSSSEKDTTKTKSTTKATASTSTKTVSSSDTTESTVWIPTKGGSKYHKKSSCSNMDNPSNVSLDDAKTKGFTPCKKCYK